MVQAPTFASWERERDAERVELERVALERVAMWQAEPIGKSRPGCAVGFVGYTAGGRPIARRCGELGVSSAHLCDPCERRAERAYRQGWRHYPGDTCRHGVYVGGSGADLMCGLCELGD